MNALTLTLIKLAFLAVLWLFVIAAVGAASGNELTGGKNRVALKMAWVALDRVRPPKDDQIGPVLDLAQRAS